MRRALVIGVVAGSLISGGAAIAARQPIPTGVVHHLREDGIRLHLARRARPMVTLSQAKSASSLHGHNPHDWLVRFSGGPGGATHRNRLAWLIIADGVVWPTPQGHYTVPACSFGDATSGKFIEAVSC